ncbi:unnamed protein product [Linum trigynum]
MQKEEEEEVPADLHIDILRRLPQSSCIVRFRCVCKSWCALISDPSFTRQKLFLNSESSSPPPPPPPLAMVIKDNNLGGMSAPESFYSLYSFNALKPSLRGEAADIRIPFNLCHYRIAGCCHGLLCLYDSRCGRSAGEAILWNPATKETKVLPPSLFNLAPHSQYACYGRLGFGFDPETNDYKVVREIDYNYEVRGWNHRKCPLFELYSLTTDSWRKIDTGSCSPFSNGHLLYLPAVSYRKLSRCYKGKLYWWSDHSSLSRCSTQIASSRTQFAWFDMSKEVFRGADVRNPSDDRWAVRWLFVPPNEEEEENDSLVAICSGGGGGGGGGRESLEVWALMKLWVPESWTKLFVVPDDYYDFVGISSNFLFYQRHKSHERSNDGVIVVNPATLTISAYHLGTGEIIDSVVSNTMVFLIMDYVPSRVSLV